MDTDSTNKATSKDSLAQIMEGIKSATPLTALQLNGYKLDVKHTVLTPEYLESLPKESQES